LEDFSLSGVPLTDSKPSTPVKTMTTMFQKTTFRPSAIAVPTLNPFPHPHPRSLAEAVQGIVAGVQEDRLEALNDRNSGFPSKLMLGLIVYCYARQVFSSAEIETMLANDVACHGLCQHDLPSTSAISRFRNDNRELIQTCLRSALRFLAQRKVADGTVTRINDSFVADEAKRRIIMAMCTDSLEFDRDLLTDIA
jgi:transposase